MVVKMEQEAFKNKCEVRKDFKNKVLQKGYLMH
jgi:hypothetical protein